MSKISLCNLRTDGGTQSRESLDDLIVKEYAEAMRGGAIFPPGVAFYDGTDTWLADGFHREAACRLAEFDEMEMEIRQGAREDAVWFACSANNAHGLRRNNDDKRRAVQQALLLHPEYSNERIADHCGVSANMVSDYRPLQSDESGPVKRVGKDNRPINVANIGKPAATSTPQEVESAQPADEEKNGAETFSIRAFNAVVSKAMRMIDQYAREVKSVTNKGVPTGQDHAAIMRNLEEAMKQTKAWYASKKQKAG